MLTFEQIKELIDLVGQRRLQGLEIERSGFRLKIDGQIYAGEPLDAVEPAGAPRAIAPRPAALPAPAPAAPAEAAGLPADAHVLRSPIVGTYYSAPAPDSAPFVKVGDTVSKGQVLCIIEAMKLMNEIESDSDGVVLEIYPANAQPVEFGEPLFAIQPA